MQKMLNLKQYRMQEIYVIKLISFLFLLQRWCSKHKEMSFTVLQRYIIKIIVSKENKTCLGRFRVLRYQTPLPKFRLRIQGQDSGSGLRFRIGIKGQDSGSVFRFRVKGQDSGLRLRIRIKGQDSGSAFRSRIQVRDSESR